MNAPLAPEQALRNRLGIPADAERVLLFAESSHWDTNWLETSEGYFRKRLEPIFAALLKQLARDEGRVYCIESVFFLKLYWERHPEHRETLRALFERRQLRLLASSFTTPDTLLPHCETVLRDFLLGQRWLDEAGLPCAPATAYFPDNFGHSPNTPSLMRELGITSVGLTRVDGMYFIASDYRGRSQFPLAGSTAEKLQRQHGSLDFVWRDEAGAEVLCHWNAFTYFQGDMLAHKGAVRWAGNVFGMSWRSKRHIAGRIKGYVRQLEPVSRTPYLFCPIGMDFNDPIDDLGGLLHRYNREHFEETGTWVTLAGLDDYFALLELHRENLPVLHVDPNPYWMGFYATRPEVKQRPTRIARTLLAAEALSAFAPPDEALTKSLRDAWSTLVLSNHHDYITGTSPDAVWHEEQRPWLDAAEKAADAALTRARADTEPKKLPPPRRLKRVRHHREGGLLHVDAPGYHLTFDEHRGGCLTHFTSGRHEWLGGYGFDLVAYHDEGGLWRLGHEFKGGRFEQLERASDGEAKVAVHEEGGALRLTITSKLRGARFVRTLWCEPVFEPLRLSVEGHAPRRVTVTARFDTTLEATHLQMDAVGGSIRRELQRFHAPTFWPVPSRLTIAEPDRAQKLHALFDTPSAVSVDERGHLEWIVARNAPKERAFRMLPVLAHPIGGTNDNLQSHHAALLPSLREDHGLSLRRARRWLDVQWHAHGYDAAEALNGLILCEGEGVEIAALKRAETGEGLIVRLASEHPVNGEVRLALRGAKLHGASRCDARERDLEPLPVAPDGSLTIKMTGFLATVRLRR